VTRSFAVASFMTLLTLSASSVQAQEPQEPLPRWDATGVLGWRGLRVTGDEYVYQDWDARFVVHGSVGYYWTPNVKTELEVGAITQSEFQTFEQRQVTGSTYPPFVRTEHRETGFPISARVLYQFGENQFFHPFVGGGVAYDRMRDDEVTPEQTFNSGVRRPDGTFEPVLNVPRSARIETHRDTRGVIILGFKAYASERGFMRTDVLWSIGSPDRRYVSWRIGAGMDF
jgi:opacity protein-like surface antigen